MIDAIVAVNVLPSLYSQMFTLCIWIMIIICVLHVCTCMTVIDFIFLCTVVYHVDGNDFRY